MIPAIKVEGLWKEYIVGSAQERHTTFYDVLSSAIKSPFRSLRRLRGQADEADRFWALRDVSFEVQPGEVLGVIGRNGAGKSTLLKILSRITAPTRGRIEVRGRLASLLEVGTGFHAELSGRENIYLNGAILGMTRAEITSKFDEIVAFAEIEKFVDTPVKRYSSGMYVRLAFAVAAHLDADILLVDEVLAVGDAEFQKRCLGKMKEVSRGGRTVLFVSHNLTAVRNLCARTVLLVDGIVEMKGHVKEVVAWYERKGGAAVDHVEFPITRAGGMEAVIRRISVEPGQGGNGARVSVKSPCLVRILIESLERDVEIAPFLNCFDKDGNLVFSSASFFDKRLNGLRLALGLHEFVCQIPENLLNDGEYTLDVLLIRDRQSVVLSEYSALRFSVEDETTGIEGWMWRPEGIVRPALTWNHRTPL